MPRSWPIVYHVVLFIILFIHFCFVLFSSARLILFHHHALFVIQPTNAVASYPLACVPSFLVKEIGRRIGKKGKIETSYISKEEREKKKETGKKCCSIDSSLSELGSTPWDADANPLDTSWMWWRLRYYRVPSSHTRTLFCEHHKKRINFYAMSAIDSSCTT